MKTFSQRLQHLREEHGLTQKALATVLHITPSAISKYEKENDRLPDFPILLAIADYFNVSLDYLLGREDIDKLIHTIEVEYGNVFTKDLALKRMLDSMMHLTDEERIILSDFIDYLAMRHR